MLRGHVLTPIRTPDLLDVIELDQLTELADWLIDRATQADVRADLEKFLPGWRTKSRDEVLTALSPIVYTTMQDAVAGGVLGTNLSFTQETVGRFYQFCAKTAGDSGGNTLAMFSHAAMLHDLELPAIDDLPDEDFVGIRLQSEDFDQFRTVLGRALKDTADRVKEGRELGESFTKSLGEVRWQADILRRDMRDKAIGKYLRNTAQNVSIGSLVSTAAAAASTSVENAVHLMPLAARFGVSAILATLMAVLLYRAPTRKQRLMRFYDVLIGEPAR